MHFYTRLNKNKEKIDDIKYIAAKKANEKDIICLTDSSDNSIISEYLFISYVNNYGILIQSKDTGETSIIVRDDNYEKFMAGGECVYNIPRKSVGRVQKRNDGDEEEGEDSKEDQ